MDPSLILGATGLTGSFILSNLLAAAHTINVQTITRRPLKISSPPSDSSSSSSSSSSSPSPSPSHPANLHSIVDTDTSAWATQLSAIRPVPETVFSALGTTSAEAGGIANQWKIDHDLNIELARAAKAAGAKTFVFLSADTQGFFSRLAPYSRMKKGVEDAIRDMGFEHTVVVRLMLILGEREKSRFSEGLAQSIARSLPARLADTFSHDAEIGARAAIRAAQIAVEGGAPSKHWVIEGSEIFRLGRDEWKKE